MYLFKNMTKIILKQAVHMFDAYISIHYINYQLGTQQHCFRDQQSMDNE